MLELETENLRADICEPGEKFNKGTRFDRAGFISQVTLNGQWTFCTEEPVSHQGAGLCSEIVCPSIDEEIEADKWFPKFGVGMLRSDKCDAYSFQQLYDFRPFPVAVEKMGNGYIFREETPVWKGFGLNCIRAVSAEGNRIHSIWKFISTGWKELYIEEYCHNFIRFGQYNTGPKLKLNICGINYADIKMKIPGCALTVNNNGFSFSRPESAVSLAEIKWDKKQPENFFWEMNGYGFRVSEKISGQPQKMTVWACPTVLSPEVRYCFKIKPGETVEYEREWTFENIIK